MTDAADKKGDNDKTITVVVNGTAHQVPKNHDLTYAEVVTYFDPTYPQHPQTVYSVTYTRGEKPKEGTLAPGGSVKAKDEMEFHVIPTSES
ncbi:multiubiquitin domain-containing protein [Mesorhizobium argentiipisi]|uniref:Multiubiquitin domain-containing protein n=1 Tax=Mesorhizobium argentiipisi TaxID=3015175 RepID=A0ABU8KAF0_9HYPH